MPTPIRLGTDSSGRAVLMTPLMAKWWDEYAEACEAKGFTPVITQGAFMAQAGGGATASAGYHDLGGCLDLRVWDRTEEQQQFMVRQARRMGAAAWIRDQKHGGMEPHIHLVLGCDDPLSIGAAAQWQAYLRGEDGLAGGGDDYHWRPTPLVTTWAPPVLTRGEKVDTAIRNTRAARKSAEGQRREYLTTALRALRSITPWVKK